METKILKWGNSLGVRIPRSFAAEARVSAGSIVKMSVGKGGIKIRPVSRRYALADLLKKVSPRNVHNEVDWGGPVGREAW